MKPPMDPLEYLENLVKGQDSLKEKSKTSEPHPGISSGHRFYCTTCWII